MNDSLEHDPLWMRIRDMDIDGVDRVLPFSRRLARDNGWEQQYANRVVEEYKRFIYLLATQGEPLTPSDQVDQAWHLHLAYSQHYWDVLCGSILDRPLHHGPTEGGMDEQAKFEEWYSRTLARYEQVFGKPPPSDCWPSPEDRFRDVEAFQRVNTAQKAVFDKGAISVFSLVFGIIVLVCGGLILEYRALLFLLGGVLLVVAFVTGYQPDNDQSKRNGGGGGGCGGCGGCGGG